MSLWSAWLSTKKKKVLSQGNIWERGCGTGGRGRRGPPSPLQALLALSTPTRCPPTREKGSRAEGISVTRPEASYPGEQDAVQVRAAGSFFPTTFLRHGPGDSLICEGGRSPSSLSSKK